MKFKLFQFDRKDWGDLQPTNYTLQFFVVRKFSLLYFCFEGDRLCLGKGIRVFAVLLGSGCLAHIEFGFFGLEAAFAVLTEHFTGWDAED